MYVRTAQTAERDIDDKSDHLFATDSQDRFTVSSDPVRASRAAWLTEDELNEDLDVYSPWLYTSSCTYNGHQSHNLNPLHPTLDHDAIASTPYSWSVSITPAIPNGQSKELRDLLESAEGNSDVKFLPEDWNDIKDFTMMPDLSEQNLSSTNGQNGEKRRYGVFKVHSDPGKATRSVAWTQIVPGIWSAASDINGDHSVKDDAECHVRLTVPDTDTAGQSPRSPTSMKSYRHRQNSRKDSLVPTLCSSPIEELSE
jgi:hypothetical protein